MQLYVIKCNSVQLDVFIQLTSSQKMRKIQSIKNIDLTSFAHLSVPKKRQQEQQKDSPFKLNLKLKTLQYSNFSNHSNLRTQNNNSKSREKQMNSTEYNTQRNYGVNQFNLSSKDALSLLYQKQKSVNLFNMKSYIRLKPSHTLHAQDLIDIPNQQTVVYHSMIYKFDKVFLSQATQSIIYDEVGQDLVRKFIEGHNGTVFAYGNTGSGKTYTMFGQGDGIVPRAVQSVFQKITTEKVSCSMLEIYKQNLIDLLSPDNEHQQLKIKEVNSTTSIQNLSIIELKSKGQTLELIKKGNYLKKIRETSLNESSSRSHIIFTLYLEKVDPETKNLLSCKLNLVDLAGSQKVYKSKVEGEGLEQAKKINLSLCCLGNTINALVKGSDHIPYRQSKLTRILKESLMGNSITRLIVTCAIDQQTIQETISSFKFAQRARKIKTQAEINLNVKKYEDQKKNNIRRLTHRIIELEDKLNKVTKIIKDNSAFCKCCEKYDHSITNKDTIHHSQIKIEQETKDEDFIKKEYQSNHTFGNRNYFSLNTQKIRSKSKKKLITNVTNNTNFTNITNITNIQKSKTKSINKYQELKEENQKLSEKIIQLEHKIKCFEQKKPKVKAPQQQKQNYFNHVNIEPHPKRIIRMINHSNDVRSPKNVNSKMKINQNQYFSNKNLLNNDVKEDQKQQTEKLLNQEYQMINQVLSHLQLASNQFKSIVNPLQKQILIEQINYLQNVVIGQGDDQKLASSHQKVERLLKESKQSFLNLIQELCTVIKQFGEKKSEEIRMRLNEFLRLKREQFSEMKKKFYQIEYDEYMPLPRKSLKSQEFKKIIHQVKSPIQASISSQNEFLNYFYEETLSCNQEIPQQNRIKCIPSKQKV